MTKPGQTKPLIVKLEIHIEATPEKIWQVFSTTQGMQNWLNMQGYEPRIGGEYRMHVTDQDGIFDFFGEVVTFDPPKVLAFTWTEQEQGKEPWPTHTLVTIQLTPTNTGTQVSLVHSGFDKLPADISAGEHEGHIEGWKRSRALIELKQIVEQEA